MSPSSLPIDTATVDQDRCESPSAMRSGFLTEELRVHEPSVRSYLHAKFPSVDADDVIQDCYLKFLRHQNADHIMSVRTYLFSMAHNTALNLIRRRRIYASTPLNEIPSSSFADPGPDAAEIADSRQRIELARKLIDGLPGRCREIMICAALHGMSPAEIAAHLGIVESTVRVQLARGVLRASNQLKHMKSALYEGSLSQRGAASDHSEQ